MKHRSMGVRGAGGAALLAISLSFVTAYAQDEWFELLRADLRADKIEVLTVAMRLTEEEGRTFWPIFRDYDNELSAIQDRRVDLIKMYADKYRTLSDEGAAEIAGDWFEIQHDLLKLKKKYYKRVEKALNSSIAARFIQVERQIELIIDVQLAAEMPLVRAIKSTGGDR